MNQNINDSKSDSYFFFFFFFKYFFGHTTFLFLYSSTHIPADIIRVFLISDFLAETIKASKNYRRRLLSLEYSLAQKTSLILWTSTHLTLKIICSCNTAKNPSEFPKNFLANMFLCDMHSTISWRLKLHSWSTLRANIHFCISS